MTAHPQSFFYPSPLASPSPARSDLQGFARPIAAPQRPLNSAQPQVNTAPRGRKTVGKQP